MPDDWETQLAQEYRASQVRIGLALTKDILTIWRYFDPQSIDQSWGTMLRAILVMTSESRVASAVQSEAYFRALSPELRAALAAQRVPTHIQTAAEKADWEARAATSLDITGNYMTKAAIGRGVDAAQAVDEAFVRVSGVSQRHALDGGRARMFELGDQAGVMKWRRIGGPNPCAFCRMLIGRGAVYRRATSTFRTHDHCQCMATPDTTGAFPPQRYGFSRQPGESQRAFYERYARTDPRAYLGGRAPLPGVPLAHVEPPWDEMARLMTHESRLTGTALPKWDDARRDMVRAALEKVEASIAHQQGFESLVLVGPDGSVVKFDGGPTSVGGYEVQAAVERAVPGTILTHNHPIVKFYGQRIANFFSDTDLNTSRVNGFIARMVRLGDGVAQATLTPEARIMSSTQWNNVMYDIASKVKGDLERLYPGPEGWQKYRLYADWEGREMVLRGLIKTDSILPDSVLLADPPGPEELKAIVNFMNGGSWTYN